MLETFNWVLAKASETKVSANMDADDGATAGLIGRIEDAGLDEAEILATKVINEQIEQLKLAAQRQMVCSVLFRDNNVNFSSFRAFWSKTFTNHHCQIFGH